MVSIVQSLGVLALATSSTKSAHSSSLRPSSRRKNASDSLTRSLISCVNLRRTPTGHPPRAVAHQPLPPVLTRPQLRQPLEAVATGPMPVFSTVVLAQPQVPFTVVLLWLGVPVVRMSSFRSRTSKRARWLRPTLTSALAATMVVRRATT